MMRPENTFISPQKFASCRILVVGDLMLDEYIWGHIDRISPEAPVPVLNLVRREDTLGGAGNVVKNLRVLGARVIALGVVGKDGTGRRIQKLLDDLGADRTGVLIDLHRTSTRKTRLMSLEHGQQVFRLDEENPHWIASTLEDSLVEKIEAEVPHADAVLCSDYLKGVLTPRVLQTTFQACRERGVPAVVAPKDSNPEKYRLAGILIPNVKELAQLVKTVPDGIEELSRAAAYLIAQLEIQALLVTRGSEGISLFESFSGTIRRLDIPTVARTVYDVTGAGDTFASAFTLALAAGADRETAARVANVAAGIVVAKRGTATVTLEEIRMRLGTEAELLAQESPGRVSGLHLYEQREELQ